MEPVEVRWVLAFDADCGTCRALSDRVKAVAGDELEVIPLSNPDVEGWRRRVLGADAPHVPCLIRLRGAEVDVWTGAAMGVRLSTRLGARGTMRLLKTLGEMRRNASRGCEEDEPRTFGRAQFLRLAGAAVAAAAITGRAVPALAAPATPSEAQKWVLANKANLPTSYADVIGFNVDYRKAIFGASTADVRSRLWLAHLREYQAAHGEMTPVQLGVVDRAAALAGDPTIFASTMVKESPRRPAMQALKDDAIAAFGKDEARKLLNSLGPESTAKLVSCNCDWADDYCSGTCTSCGCYDAGSCRRCNSSNCWCTCSEMGCGTLWVFPCTGTCG